MQQLNWDKIVEVTKILLDHPEVDLYKVAKVTGSDCANSVSPNQNRNSQAAGLLRWAGPRYESEPSRILTMVAAGYEQLNIEGKAEFQSYIYSILDNQSQSSAPQEPERPTARRAAAHTCAANAGQTIFSSPVNRGASASKDLKETTYDPKSAAELLVWLIDAKCDEEDVVGLCRALRVGWTTSKSSLLSELKTKVEQDLKSPAGFMVQIEGVVTDLAKSEKRIIGPRSAFNGWSEEVKFQAPAPRGDAPKP